MDLITKVKVSGVNALTDARFFSGAGATYIGFCFDENSTRFIPSEKVYMIKEWLVGPSFVGEFTVHSKPDEINLIADKAGLDYVQLSESFSPALNNEINRPIFQEIVIEGVSELNNLQSRLEERQENVEVFILNFLEDFPLKDFEGVDSNNLNLIWGLTQRYKVIIDTKINKENVLDILQFTRAYGINIPAGNEIKTGVQSFDDSADLLEVLEKESD